MLQSSKFKVGECQQNVYLGFHFKIVEFLTDNIYSKCIVHGDAGVFFARKGFVLFYYWFQTLSRMINVGQLPVEYQ